MLVLLGLYGFFLGSSVASFACVVSERVPAGKSINGRSQCACGRQLKASENVPVFGWLAARGTTRCCAVRLPVRYVVAEASLGLVGLAGFVLSGRLLGHGHPWWFAALPAAVAISAGFGAVTAFTWQRSRRH